MTTGIRKLALTLIVAAVFAGSAAVPAARAADAPMSATDAAIFKQAQERFKGKDYRAVQKLLSSVHKAAKPHSFGITLLGMSYMRTDEYALAAEVFEKGAALYPENFAIHNNLAIALFQAERFERAAEVFLASESLAKSGERKNSLRLSAAQSLYRAEKYQQSRQVLLPLMSAGAPAKAALQLMGAVCVKLSLWQPAAGAFEKLVAIDPLDRQSWEILGAVRMQMSRRQDAAAALQIAEAVMRLTPKNLPENTAVGEIKATTKTTSKAQKKEEKDREESRQGRYRNLASVYMQLQAPYLQLNAMNYLPAEEKILTQRLAVERNSGQTHKALETLRRLHRCCEKPVYYQIEGSLYYRLGNLEKAQQAYCRGGEGNMKASERSRFLCSLVAWERGKVSEAAAGFKSITHDDSLTRQAKQALVSIETLEAAKIEVEKSPKAEETSPIPLKTN